MKNRMKQMAATLIQHNPRHDPPHQKTEITGWFRRRKKAEDRLKAFSNSTVSFAGSGFYWGPDHRHWLRHTCGCHFLASEVEVAQLGEEVCVYCGVHHVEDLARFGSVAAIRELVAMMSGENLEFCANNRLGQADDLYVFYCHIHQAKVHRTFADFVARPDEVCVDCFFDALKRRSAAGEV